MSKKFENIPPTPKEKMLIKSLVRLYTSERLEEEISDNLQYNESSLVEGTAKLLGIDKNLASKLSIQYLNYAVENYELIKSNEFPDEFERIKQITMNIIEHTVEYNSNTLELTIDGLLKYKDRSIDDVKENLYEYGPKTIASFFGDTETEDVEEPTIKMVTESPNNVIY